MRAFVSHSTQDSELAIELAMHLNRCLDGGVFYFEDCQRQAVDGFQTTYSLELGKCDVLVVLVGQKLANAMGDADSYQIAEVQTFDRLSRHSGSTKRPPFFVLLRDDDGRPYELPAALNDQGGFRKIEVAQGDTVGSSARDVASHIIKGLGQTWRSLDDLPFEPYLFSLEQDITRFFANKQNAGPKLFESDGLLSDSTRQGQDGEVNYREMREKIILGCPSTWPIVQQESGEIANPLKPEDVGTYRPPTARVVVTARESSEDQRDQNVRDLHFLEAGPRAELRFGRPGDLLTVGLLVSGGIAPGTNAVIDGIVQRHTTYARKGEYDVLIYGIRRGFAGIAAADRDVLHPSETAKSAGAGGSILPTSRVEQLVDHDKRGDYLSTVAASLATQKYDILYIIGGDGSMRAAHALWSTIEELNRTGHLARRISIIGVPKTMDNDILWVWQSFGFLSAVEKAREVVEDLGIEVSSNPRACVVQLFGSDSGFVVSHAVLASGFDTCDAALIPEAAFCTHALVEHLVNAVTRRRQHNAGTAVPSTMVVMAETAIPVDAIDYLDDVDTQLTKDEANAIEDFERRRRECRRIEGQTPDKLRDAGLKIVMRGIKKLAPAPQRNQQIDWGALRLLRSEPRHLLRTIRPNAVDRIMAQRLGLLAVDNALAGYTDFMISQWLTEYVLVPLKLVTLGRKRIPEHGMFWKSLLAKTLQPPTMICHNCARRAAASQRPATS